MPTYEYECKACSHRFERFQSITEKPIRKCPECGKLQARRLISAGAGFIFKGSGFYQTDYRSDEYKKKAKADSGESTKKDEGSSPPSKGETTPKKDGNKKKE